MARKYGKKSSKQVESAMRRRKRGTLRSGSGKKVKSKKQAVAIGLSEARRSGAKAPKKKGTAKKKGRKKGGRKKGTRKKTTRKKGGRRKKKS